MAALTKRINMGRRQFLCGCCASFGAAATARATPASADPVIVPVEMAPFHMEAFDNDYVRFLNVNIPAGKIGAWHRHTIDLAQVTVDTGPIEVTVLNGAPTRPVVQAGAVLFSNYSKQPLVHQIVNIGTSNYHVMGIEILDSKPGRFAPSDLPLPYTSVIHNDRLEGWRLVLQPGQSAPSVSQVGPGVRIVVQGGDIIEHYDDQTSHEFNLSHADFFWQDPGLARSIQNVGNTPVEFIDFELK
jgi:hypothetical protein